jgi:hypothetical protein
MFIQCVVTPTYQQTNNEWSNNQAILAINWFFVIDHLHSSFSHVTPTHSPNLSFKQCYLRQTVLIHSTPTLAATKYFEFSHYSLSDPAASIFMLTNSCNENDTHTKLGTTVLERQWNNILLYIKMKNMQITHPIQTYAVHYQCRYFRLLSK